MAKFALKHIEEIKGRIQFYYLLIDGDNQYEEIAREIRKEGSYANELITLQSRMQEMAEMKYPLPKEKCRDITPKKEKNKEYELKTKHQPPAMLPVPRGASGKDHCPFGKEKAKSSTKRYSKVQKYQATIFKSLTHVIQIITLSNY